MSKGQKIGERRVEMRKRLFPHIGADELWARQTSTGFTTIPRALPLLMTLMDRMSKGKPLSATYFELWCRLFDDAFVNLKPREMAYHAGFSGQRAEQTWSERMRILTKLNFIATQPGPEGDLGYAVIFNPYKVIKKHFEQNTPGLDKRAYHSLIQRATEIGARDLDEPVSEDVNTPAPVIERDGFVPQGVPQVARLRSSPRASSKMPSSRGGKARKAA